MRCLALCLTIFSGLLTAADKPDPIDEQIRRVESFAAAEPPIFGIGTRLKEVEILSQKHPARARAALDRTVEVLSGIRDPASYSQFLIAAVEAMASLNAAEAERLIQRMPPRPNSKEDYRAKAWDNLIRRAHLVPASAVDRALVSGAFRLEHAVDLLNKQLPADPGAATALFARVLQAFPTDAGQEDALFLGICAMKIVTAAPDLAVTGADRALRAGWIADEAAVKQLTTIDEDFAIRNREYLTRKPPPPGKFTSDPNLFTEGPADASGLSIAAAIDLARKQPPGPLRTGALLRLSRREDLSTSQREALAAEALDEARKIDVTDGSRLFAFSMLAHDFSKRGDHTHAARAAKLMAESFMAVCKCDDTSCDSLEGREDCAEMVDMFVDYMEEESLTPDDLALSHPSLSSRLALRDLVRLVGYKKKSIF